MKTFQEMSRQELEEMRGELTARFEEIKAEMDFVRGKRTRGGKVSVKKFIDGLLIFTE